MRNIALDILKIVLAVMVVFLHSRFLSEYHPTASYVTVQGLFRIAVPTFFIINGFFFAQVIEKRGLSKWLKKAVPLYLLWMLIYSLFWFTRNFSEVAENILVGYHHLWYIKAMILCGLILYVVHHWNHTLLAVLAALLFITGVAIQYVINYDIFYDFPNENENLRIIYTHRNFLFLGLPFYTLGFLFKKRRIHLSPSVIKSLTLLGIALLLAESYANSIFTDQGFDNLFFLGLACPMVFLFASRLKINSPLRGKTIAQFSTAIYLIHPWIMTILTRTFPIEPTSLSLVTVALSLPLSLVIIRLNERYRLFLL